MDVPAVSLEPASAGHVHQDALRLLFFYDAIYPQSTGGVEHRNLQLAAALARRGHEVTLAGWFDSEPPGAPGVRYQRLPGGVGLYTTSGRRSTSAALRLARAALTIDLAGFDVIETANIPYIHVLPLAARAALKRKLLLVTWHEYWGRYWADYLQRWIWPLYAAVEWCAAQAGMVISVSAFTRDRLAHRRLRKTAIPVVANGISLPRLLAAAERAPASAPPLVYAGRLLREKRIDVLLEAIALLPRSPDGPLLTIIGTGPDEERLRQLAEKPGIAGNVTFTGRLGSSEDVWARMAGARLAIQPSSREGFGMFPLEAMALGLPVIYCHSTESALPELVVDGREGVAVNPEPAALAAAIRRLLDDPQETAWLGANARQKAADYDWDRLAGRLETIVRARLRR